GDRVRQFALKAQYPAEGAVRFRIFTGEADGFPRLSFCFNKVAALRKRIREIKMRLRKTRLEFDRGPKLRNRSVEASLVEQHPPERIVGLRAAWCHGDQLFKRRLG